MTTAASGGDAYVLCEVAGATYALRSDDVVRLEMATPATPVPNAPPHVDGVVAVRGQVVPAMSLRARFGFPRVAPDLRSRLVVVRSAGRTVALVVDGAREFARVAPDAVRPLPEGVGGTSGRYLRGIAQHGDRLLLVLDVPELLALEPDLTDPAPDPAAHDAPPTGAPT
jgi:purine-binding chemotaxis protein CheW